MSLPAHLLLAAASVAAPVQITNLDDCSNAGVDVLIGAGTFYYDTWGATTGSEGQGEGACAGDPTSEIYSDIWLTWRAITTGQARISCCSSQGWQYYNSRIHVWPGGTSCPIDGTSLACGSLEGACTVFNARTTFPVTAGDEFVLQVGGSGYPWGAAYGPGELRINEAPAATNDERHTALPLVAGFGQSTYTPSVSASPHGTGCYQTVDRDLWFEYVAASDDVVFLDGLFSYQTLV